LKSLFDPLDLSEPFPPLKIVPAASGAAWIGSEVILSAAVSGKVAGTVIRTRWRQTQGPPIPLADASAPTASVVPVQPGHYSYQVDAEYSGFTTTAAVSVDALQPEPESVTVTGRVQLSSDTHLFLLSALTIETSEQRHVGFIRPDGSFTVPIPTASMTPVRLLIHGPGVEDCISGLVYIDRPGSTVSLPVPISVKVSSSDVVGYVLDSWGNLPSSWGDSVDTVHIAELGSRHTATVVNGSYYLPALPSTTTKDFFSA
jgi:hypothetical protein